MKKKRLVPVRQSHIVVTAQGFFLYLLYKAQGLKSNFWGGGGAGKLILFAFVLYRVLSVSQIVIKIFL